MGSFYVSFLFGLLPWVLCCLPKGFSNIAISVILVLEASRGVCPRYTYSFSCWAQDISRFWETGSASFYLGLRGKSSSYCLNASIYIFIIPFRNQLALSLLLWCIIQLLL